MEPGRLLKRYHRIKLRVGDLIEVNDSRELHYGRLFQIDGKMVRRKLYGHIERMTCHDRLGFAVWVRLMVSELGDQDCIKPGDLVHRFDTQIIYDVRLIKARE